MALQLRRGETRSFGKMIATSFAVMAFVLQPLVALNIPSAFAVGPSTLYVDATTGVAGAACSQADPCKTISEAITKANGGDTVKVAPGTYTGDLAINKKVNLQSGATDAIIEGRVTFGTGSDGSRLYKFTVSTTGLDYSVGVTNASDITISNNTLAHTSMSGVSAKAVYIGDGNDNNVTVTNNNIRAVTSDEGAYGVLVNKKSFSGLRITNNNIKTLTGGWTHAIGLEGDTPGAVVTNNHISGLSTHNNSLDLFSVYFEDNASAKTVTVSGDYNGKPVSNSNNDVLVNSSWAGYPANVEVLANDGTYRYIDQNAFATLSDGVAGVAAGGIVSLDSDISTGHQLTITRSGVTIDGRGHKITATFDKTAENNNAVLGIAADDVTLNKVIVDGGTHNLHGINVVDQNGVTLSSVTAQNAGNTGINIVSSDVTVSDVTTSHNGWHGIDVDLSKGTVTNSSAKLTVNGTSHHDGEIGGDIFVDNTKKNVSVVDTNNQYGYIDLGVERIYNLKLAAPTLVYPADNGYTTTNDFDFTWNTVPGAVKYEFQNSTTDTSSNGALTSIKYHAVTTDSTPELHSSGAADGTVRYWQVRAIDAYGIPGSWSPIWKMTIDMTKPAVPTDLVWTGNGSGKYQNGATNIQNGTLTWKDSTPNDVDHYIYKFWTDISGFEDDANNPWTDSYSYVKMDSDGGHVVTNFAQNNEPKQGTYFFCVEAVDKAGNNSGCSTVLSVTYDTTPGTLTASLSSTYFSKNSVDPSLSGNLSDDISGAGSLQYMIWHYSDTASNHRGTFAIKNWTSLLDNSQIGQKSVDFNAQLGLNQLPEGKYIMGVRGTNRVGLSAGATQDFVFVVDNAAPSLAITGYTVNGDGTYTVNGTTDDNSADVIVSVGLHNKTVTPVNGHWSANIGAIADGTYTVIATSTDASGNTIQISQKHAFSTPISQDEQSQGVLPNSKNNTAPAAAAQFFAVNNQAVLGTQNNKANDDAVNGQAVKGVSTTKDNANSDNKSNGFAWYWWLIAAAVAAFLWWLIAAARRRKQAE